MKMAKVSPIYEGKLGKRGREGDEEDEEWRSRMARIDARARMRNLRNNYPRAPPLPVPSHAWSMTNITTGASSSMESSTGENYEENQEVTVNETENQDDDDDMVIDVEEWTKEVINIEDDDENETKDIIINVDDKKEETEEQKPETETEAAVGPEDRVGSYGRFVGLEEWPMTWSYEEEWLWWGRAPLGLGSRNPRWEYISGVGWIEKPPSQETSIKVMDRPKS